MRLTAKRKHARANKAKVKVARAITDRTVKTTETGNSECDGKSRHER